MTSTTSQPLRSELSAPAPGPTPTRRKEEPSTEPEPQMVYADQVPLRLGGDASLLQLRISARLAHGFQIPVAYRPVLYM